MIINCLQCEKQHKACRKTQRFCSTKCDAIYRYANGFKANTDGMHKVLREKGHYKRDNSYLTLRNPATQSGVGNKISNTKTGVPVSKLRGKNHWNWRGGVITNWGTPEYKAWRKFVMKRDNYTCQDCGDNKGGNLEVDHIKPRYLFPELTLDATNGRTLCVDCHKQTKTWGYKVKSLTRADFSL